MPPISGESELGPYSVLHVLPELRQDGLGEAWLAEFPEKEQQVTLNILRVPHQDISREDEQAYGVFRHEVEVLRRLRHPHIVRIYPLPPKALSVQGEDYLSEAERDGESWWYWAMEHLEGGSLKARMERGRLTVEEAAEIIYQVGSALDYVHSKNIVHLNIQPESVFFRYSLDGLDPEVELVLTSFGGAARADEPLFGDKRSNLSSRVYMAPERIRPKAGYQSIDNRAVDVYSLGVLFYRLLAGKLPFSGSEEDVERAILAAEPNPLVRFDVPAAVEALIFQAMRKNPEDRPTTEAFLTALDRAVPPPRKVRTGAEIPAVTTRAVPSEEVVAERERRREEPSGSFFKRLRNRLFGGAPSKPKLLVPEDEAVLDGRVIFAWDWNGELKKDQAFELRMWKEDQSHDRVGELQTEPELEIDLDTVVPELPGEEAECLWTVAVVRTSPYGSLSEEADPRSFRYGEEGEEPSRLEGERRPEERRVEMGAIKGTEND